MIGLRSVRMTLLLALVLVAVKVMLAGILTIELAGPGLDHGVCAIGFMSVIAFLLIPFIFAEYVLLDMSAITTSRHSHLATTA